MFSPEIVQQDSFLDMPHDSQLLYFHLSLTADDEGFVSPKKVLKMTGCPDNNLAVLIAKGLVIPFENGVVVIRHWKQNNFIRKDRFVPTVFEEQRKNLVLDRSNTYFLKNVEVATWIGLGQPMVNLEREIDRKEAEKTSNEVEEGKEKIDKKRPENRNENGGVIEY